MTIAWFSEPGIAGPSPSRSEVAGTGRVVHLTEKLHTVPVGSTGEQGGSAPTCEGGEAEGENG
jgi:hypothetical protein